MVSQIRSAVNPNPMTTKIRRRRTLLRLNRRSPVRAIGVSRSSIVVLSLVNSRPELITAHQR
jgi:hypothetical protein